MAKFIPNIPESFHGSLGEEEVYNSLSALDDKFYVFHSLSWVGAGREILGEADFVIAHPDKGILVVEVKSGGIEYKDGMWIQSNTTTRESKRISPYDQASRSKFDILDRLRSNLNFQSIPMVCHAVWFTSIELNRKQILPPEAPHEITLDKLNLAKPSDSINNLFKYWEHKLKIRIKLSDFQFGEIISVLCPYFNVVPKLSTLIAETEQQYIRLTNQQTALLNFLDEQRTAVVNGLAGTGKTVMAIEKAKILAETGNNVLLLCYNSFLREWLKINLSVPNLTCHTIHSLAYEYLNDSTIPLDELVAKFVEKISGDNGKNWNYDHVIVDEGQDIDDDILCIIEKLMKGKSGCFYVFYDKYQLVQRNCTSIPKWIENAECRLVLHRNYRNTVQIFKTACSILGIERKILSNNINGDKPVLELYNKNKPIHIIVEEFIKYAIDGGLKPDDIVILTAKTVEKSLLKDTKVAGYDLTLTFAENKILFTTIRKFKGLEAGAILIIDVSVHDLKNQDIQRLIYVGSSRAKHLLKLAVLEDIDPEAYDTLFKIMSPGRKVPRNRKGLGRLLNADII